MTLRLVRRCVAPDMSKGCVIASIPRLTMWFPCVQWIFMLWLAPPTSVWRIPASTSFLLATASSSPRLVWLLLFPCCCLVVYACVCAHVCVGVCMAFSAACTPLHLTDFAVLYSCAEIVHLPHRKAITCGAPGGEVPCIWSCFHTDNRHRCDHQRHQGVHACRGSRRQVKGTLFVATCPGWQ